MVVHQGLPTPTPEFLCLRYARSRNRLSPDFPELTGYKSGAIIDYLVGEYDKDAKLHYTNSPEKYLQNSWAHFQMSGQGPYYGQKAWFSMVSSRSEAPRFNLGWC